MSRSAHAGILCAARSGRPAPVHHLLLALCAMLLTAAALAQPIAVRDDRGTEHRFAAPPQRIVTMLPSLTEIVWVLGAGPRLVGVDRYSNWPEPVATLPHLGGMEDAQIEAIAALSDDDGMAAPTVDLEIVTLRRVQPADGDGGSLRFTNQDVDVARVGSFFDAVLIDAAVSAPLDEESAGDSSDRRGSHRARQKSQA